MASLPNGTVTFLFTDIEGSTALLQQLPDAYATAMMECRRLVRAAVQERGGQEVGTQGDAVFAALPSAREALLAAIAAQQAILRHPWPDGAAMKVRMGLHTGEVERVGRTVQGIAVHTAARIAALASSSEVLVSATVKDLVAGSGLTFENRGTHTLKGPPEPRQVFAVSGES